MECLSFCSASGTRERVATKGSIYYEQAGGIGGWAGDVLLLGVCDEAVRKLAKELEWMQGVEEVWWLVRGERDKRAEAAAEGSQDAELAESINAKARRLIEDIQHAIFVVNGRKESLMKDLSIQETLINGPG